MEANEYLLTNLSVLKVPMFSKMQGVVAQISKAATFLPKQELDSYNITVWHP
jgi:hypothetical protein